MCNHPCLVLGHLYLLQKKPGTDYPWCLILPPALDNHQSSFLLYGFTCGHFISVGSHNMWSLVAGFFFFLLSVFMIYSCHSVYQCFISFYCWIIFYYIDVLCCAKLFQSCLSLCHPLDCSPPGPSVHGILQARMLEWAAVPPPGELPDPGIEPVTPAAPALQADPLQLSHQGSALLGYIIVYFPFISWWMFGLLRLWLLSINAAMNICVQVFVCFYMFSLLLGVQLGVKLLCHMVSFPKCYTILQSPQQCIRVLTSPHPLQ